MNEEIETKLIDTPNEVITEYWTNEWVNEDEIIDGLVEESVVLTIAKEKIRNRLISVSEQAKTIEKNNKELRQKIYDYENKISELEKELSKQKKKLKKKLLRY